MRVVWAILFFLLTAAILLIPLIWILPLFGVACTICPSLQLFVLSLISWIIIGIAILLLLGVLLWFLNWLGIPCIFCGLAGPRKAEFGAERAPPRRGSIKIPRDVYKRPDPLIYSQEFLISHGLAVTWDNPDIWLQSVGADGKPAGHVPSHELTADTDYYVTARIWNGSAEAPAIGLPVQFSYLTFGIGMTNTPIGVTSVDLPAKGLPGAPAFALMKWRTPAVPGHYCLQVNLVWSDDAEPANNLGQTNTDVRALNSPHAKFTFPLRNNDTKEQRALRLEADFYRLGERPQCAPDQPRRINAILSREEIARQLRQARAEHQRQLFNPPSDWTINLSPRMLELPPGGEQMVAVDVTAPDGFKGRQPINVNAFAGDRIVGGVTLYVTDDSN